MNSEKFHDHINKAVYHLIEGLKNPAHELDAVIIVDALIALNNFAYPAVKSAYLEHLKLVIGYPKDTEDEYAEFRKHLLTAMFLRSEDEEMFEIIEKSMVGDCSLKVRNRVYLKVKSFDKETFLELTDRALDNPKFLTRLAEAYYLEDNNDHSDYQILESVLNKFYEKTPYKVTAAKEIIEKKHNEREKNDFQN